MGPLTKGPLSWSQPGGAVLVSPLPSWGTVISEQQTVRGTLTIQTMSREQRPNGGVPKHLEEEWLKEMGVLDLGGDGRRQTPSSDRVEELASRRPAWAH